VGEVRSFSASHPATNGLTFFLHYFVRYWASVPLMPSRIVFNRAFQGAVLIDVTYMMVSLSI
jgi:hypothetical protein